MAKVRDYYNSGVSLASFVFLSQSHWLPAYWVHFAADWHEDPALSCCSSDLPITFACLQSLEEPDVYHQGIMEKEDGCQVHINAYLYAGWSFSRRGVWVNDWLNSQNEKWIFLCFSGARLCWLLILFLWLHALSNKLLLNGCHGNRGGICSAGSIVTGSVHLPEAPTDRSPTPGVGEGWDKARTKWHSG